MKTEFRVSGMRCAACSAHVEGAVARTEGVDSVSVSLLTGSMTVTHTCPQEEIIGAVRRAGFGAEVFVPSGASALPPPEGTSWRRLFFSLLLSLPLMYLGMGVMLFGAPLPQFLDAQRHPAAYVALQLVLALAVCAVNFSYFRSGFAALVRRAPNMDTLISLGAGAALLQTVITLLAIWLRFPFATHGNMAMPHVYAESAAMILTLVTLGKTLEGRQKDKTAAAIRALASLAPEKARVLREGVEVEISADEVQKGDTVLIRAGERIPVDGMVTLGEGEADESSLTGESMPVAKSVGDTLGCGCVLVAGYVQIRADRVGEDTSLAETLRMVSRAAASKAPIARMADRVSAIFVPSVLGIACLTLAVWWVLALFEVSTVTAGIEHAIAVLVISCPCALGLATPTAIMTATGRGAELGILIKSAEALEALGHIDTVVLDKTGTVTEGKMVLTHQFPAPGVDPLMLQKIAYALESPSSHPIAHAVCTALPRTDTVATDFAALDGRGVYGRVEGVKCFAGNALLMEELEIDVSSLSQNAASLPGQGATLIYVTHGATLLGLLAVSDRVRPDSTEAIATLHRMGLSTVMLTGDHPEVAAYVCEQAGIDGYRASLMPDEKAQEIAAAQANGAHVLMVGDGINDAVALTQADVGVAIGAGTDVAIESADIVLPKSSLSQVATAIRLGRKTLRNVKQNLLWALLYNSIGIPLAAGALVPLGISLPPVFGALAMSVSSLCVVTNALRLRRFK